MLCYVCLIKFRFESYLYEKHSMTSFRCLYQSSEGCDVAWFLYYEEPSVLLSVSSAYCPHARLAWSCSWWSECSQVKGCQSENWALWSYLIHYYHLVRSNVTVGQFWPHLPTKSTAARQEHDQIPPWLLLIFIQQIQIRRAAVTHWPVQHLAPAHLQALQVLDEAAAFTRKRRVAISKPYYA